MGNNQSPNLGSADVEMTASCNVEGKANSLARNSDRHRSCGIAISNVTTNYSLTQPYYHYSSGRLQGMPSIIDAEHTGFMLGESRRGLLEGSNGVISYEIEPKNGNNNERKKLQILWYVPLDLNFFNCSVNVRVSNDESAIRDIYKKMYGGQNGYGYWCDAINTTHVFHCDEHFEAEVLMSNNEKSSLVIKFRERIN